MDNKHECTICGHEAGAPATLRIHKGTHIEPVVKRVVNKAVATVKKVVKSKAK